MKNFLCSTVILIGLWADLMAQSTTIIRGPYLQMGTPTSITFRWNTSTLTRGQVHYGTQPGSLTGVATGGPTSTTAHSIQLTDLLTNTKYYYSIEAVGPPMQVLEASADHYFTTAPTPGTVKKTKIWVLGDFGTDPATSVMINRQDSVIAAYKAFMQQNSLDPMDIWLWLGDNAYDTGSYAEYQTSVFDKTRARYDWAFRKTPFYATPGNHEYKSGANFTYDRKNHNVHYYDVVSNFTNAEGGGEPSTKEDYYSFNYSNVHFISLDTYGVEDNNDTEDSILALHHSDQRNWLRKDLLKTQADPAINWTIVFTHMPPYTGGTHNSDTENDLKIIRQNLVPLLDSFKVDLVLTGHSHAYERSRLMRGLTGLSNTYSPAINTPAVGSNAQGSGRYDGLANSCFYHKSSKATTNEGIIYVVNGAGGRAEYQTVNRTVTGQVMQVHSTRGGSMYIEANGKRLDVKYIATDIVNTFMVADQFTIFKDIEGFNVANTDGNARSATCECTEASGAQGFTHYTDNQANLLLSIKKNGSAIGTAGVSPFNITMRGTAGVTSINANSPTSYVRRASYGYRNVVAPWIVFNRYWTMTPTTELTGNNQVVIRQYYTEADMTALNAPYTDDPMSQGNLNPFKVNDNGVTSYDLNPATGHSAIPAALAYNRPGAWVYETPETGPSAAYPTTFWWGRGSMGNGRYYGEYIAGRLKGGGGFGAPSNFSSNPTGKKEQALGIWNYLVSSTEPPSEWKSNVFFDVASWERGYPPFGYSPGGQDEELTVIPNGCPPPNNFNTNCQTKNITTYFRAFAFIDHIEAPFFQSYILNYRRDDGIIIYLNGQEILPRDPNMPTGTFTSSSTAMNATNETEWRTIIIPKSSLLQGFNLLAAEVHQTSAGSSDLHFNMELIGTPDLAMTPIGLREAAPDLAKIDAAMPVIYPNPIEKDRVYFSQPLEYQSFQLVDLQGKTKKYVSTPGTLRELDVSSLPAGAYILISQDGQNISRYKLVKP